MSDDVVAELERWADDMRHHDADILLRARDEIAALRTERDKLTWEIINHAPERDELVALREQLREQNAISVTLENAHAATRTARDEALEEAVTVCRLLGQGGNMETALACAAAIRALKEQRDG